MVASYHLDTWGNFRFPDELQASKNRFSFTGYIWDKETRLFFAKARFYDPELGRFISQDSFLGEISEPPSLHRYLYAHANPTRFIDPTGHDVWDYAKGFAQGFKEGYMESAADIGDSLAGFAKGVYGGGKGLVTGVAGLGIGAVKLQANVTLGTAEYALTGNASRLQKVASDLRATGSAVKREVKLMAGLAKMGYSDPGLALDAAAELGIEKTGEVLGGATFETALLVAPVPKGAQVIKEGRKAARGVAAVSRNAAQGGRAARGVAGTAGAGTAAAPGVAAGSKLSLGSRVAREILRPLARRAGARQRILRPGRKLTFGDKARRFFLQDTRSHPRVSASPVGRFLKETLGLKIEQHHVFLQRKWIRPGGPHQWYAGDVLAQRGLQRLADAGANLMPVPRALNQFLGRTSAGTALFGGGVAGGVAGLAGGAGYGVYSGLAGETADSPMEP